MARPKNLNYKGKFNVKRVSSEMYALTYLGRVILRSPSRCRLYTARSEYSSWFERITSLLISYTEPIDFRFRD